jgi:peroxiredoxin
VELQGRVKEIEAAGKTLVAISYDSPEVLAAFSRQFGITFPLLSDKGSATIRRFGLLNTVAEEAVGPNRDDPEVAADVRKYVSEVGASDMMVGIAYPGTLMLDPRGVVEARFFEESYIERNTAAEVLVKLDGRDASVTGTRVSTDHLEVTAYPTDAAVAPGNRFALVFEVTPRPGMHVYAPGAKDYRIVSFNLDAQPFLRAQPVVYPASEIYHFEPLDERVPVYQKPFTLVQEVTLAGDLATQKQLRGQESITITGSLDYQACDDKICYNPASVSLSWTLPLRPIVFQRPARAQ